MASGTLSIRGTWLRNQCPSPKRIWPKAISLGNRRHRSWEWSDHTLQDYIACQERLGYDPLEASEIEATERSYAEVIARFGHPFRTQYGWAAQQLSSNQPSFSDIERAMGIDHLRAHYRMASHNVHANPKGVFFKLGLLEESELLLAGPSNAGFADPGHSAAISLVQASTPLGLLHPTLDNIIVLRIMVDLVDEIGSTFADAHQQLVADTAEPGPGADGE